MFRITTLFPLLFLISTLCLNAQTLPYVSGRVTESRIVGLPMPVSAAKVKARRISDGVVVGEAVTDSRGAYSIKELQAGSYELIVDCDVCSNVGPTRITLADTSVRRDIELLPAVGSQTVTISADRVQSQEEIAKSVTVIDGQEMRDRADFSLADALRTVPGFRVQQFGGFGKTAVIKTRGLRNQDTAVLIDGVRLRDVSAITGDASAFIGDITLTSVSKIEILRGSGSSIYGTNSIGGTIDFQTPRAASGWHGQFGGAIGGLGLTRFRTNLSRATSDERYGVSSGFSRTAVSRGVDGNDDARNSNIQFRFDGRPSDSFVVSTKFFRSGSFVKLNTNPEVFGVIPSGGIVFAKKSVNFSPDADDPDASQHSTINHFGMSTTFAPNDKLVFSGNLSIVASRRFNSDGPLGCGYQSSSTSLYEGGIVTFGGRAEWNPSERNNIRIGYEFEREKFLNDGRTPTGTEDYLTRAGQTSSSFYAQDLMRFMGGRAVLAGSVRWQRFSASKPKFSLSTAPYQVATTEPIPSALTFDGAFTYNLRPEGTVIRAHAGNGFRVPSLYERFGSYFSVYPVPGFTALGDPNLKPERTLAFDAGIEQQLFSRTLKLSATYFYTWLNDVIGYGYNGRSVPGASRPYGGYLNQKGGISRGLETFVDWNPDSSFEIFGSYTFTNSDQRNPQIPSSRSLESLGIGNHQVTMSATKRFSEFWINTDLSGQSSYLAPLFNSTTFTSHAFRFAGIKRVDLTAGRNFKLRPENMRLRVFATAENLFGQNYFEGGFATSGRSVRLSTVLSF